MAVDVLGVTGVMECDLIWRRRVSGVMCPFGFCCETNARPGYNSKCTRLCTRRVFTMVIRVLEGDCRALPGAPNDVCERAPEVIAAKFIGC